MSLTFLSIKKDWQVVPIQDLVFFQEGPGVRNYQYTDSGVKLLNGGNINDGILSLDTTERYISEDEAYGKYKHFLVDNGDLIIACSGISVEKFDGKITYAKESDLPLCMNTSTMRFKTLDDKILHLDYFRWYLTTPIFKNQLRKLITGSAQLNFGPSHIKQMVIHLPPLAEQKRIAAILDKADNIRRKREQAIKLADDFLKATFLEMFGDPVENSKNWKYLKLSEVGSLDRGRSKHRPRNAPELLNGKYPLIQTGDVANSGGYITQYTSTYSELGLAQSKIWNSGTLCITIAANIAKTGILTFDACFPDSVVGFQPNNQIEVEFVQHWFGFLQKQLEESAPEVAQKNINLEILRNLNIIIPDKNLQIKFKNIVLKVNKIKQKFKSKSFEPLLKGLSSKFFS